MKIIIFGLTVSSSWGNGHATLWRGLCRALGERGHEMVFFEHDVPYYREHRDMTELPGGRLVLYRDWDEIRHSAEHELADADVGMVTSYCPDAVAASELVQSSAATLSVFYDLDTPVTLSQMQTRGRVDYIGSEGLGGFDLVLSYTGGAALEELSSRLGARRVAVLYGSVDPEVHKPVPSAAMFRCDLSYLGTYARDRQSTLEKLFIETARRSPHKRFLIGGAQYPPEFPWSENIFFARHVSPADHPAFYCSSRLTLNVTRDAMAKTGYCPSGRLFEAAACGVPIVSDRWSGLEEFFTPGVEILIADSTDDVLAALSLSDEELARLAESARERALAEHSAECRAADFESAIEAALSRHIPFDEAQPS
jgi:spore maturation protein CgeB